MEFVWVYSIRYNVFMLMREKIRKVVKDAAGKLGETGDFKFDVSYPDFKFGDYATNAALVLSKQLKKKSQDLAKALIEKMDQSLFEKVEIAGPGFINFKLKTEVLTAPSLSLRDISPKGGEKSGKILLEYFQPNIAKPLHIGHLRTAIIGDALKRMLVFTT